MADEVRGSTDAGADAAPGPRIIVERPPPGLARGKYGWPAWGIATVGGIVVALAIAYWVWRWYRARRK
jgi:hypothetical protein